MRSDLEQEVVRRPDQTGDRALPIVAEFPRLLRQFGVGIDVTVDRRAVGQDKLGNLRPGLVQARRCCKDTRKHSPAVNSGRRVAGSCRQLAVLHSLHGGLHSINADYRDLLGESSVGNDFLRSQCHVVVVAVDSSQIRILVEDGLRQASYLVHVPVAEFLRDNVDVRVFLDVVLEALCAGLRASMSLLAPDMGYLALAAQLLDQFARDRLGHEHVIRRDKGQYAQIVQFLQRHDQRVHIDDGYTSFGDGLDWLLERANAVGLHRHEVPFLRGNLVEFGALFARVKFTVEPGDLNTEQLAEVHGGLLPFGVPGSGQPRAGHSSLQGLALCRFRLSILNQGKQGRGRNTQAEQAAGSKKLAAIDAYFSHLRTP